MSKIFKITAKQNIKLNGKKYIAVPYVTCSSCALTTEAGFCEQAPCFPRSRDDGQEVMFIKKKKAKK